MAKCYCMGNPEYWDDANKCVTDKVNKYIQECAIHARKIHQEAQAVTDPVERYRILSQGLTGLHTLKEYDFGYAAEARVKFDGVVPFKIRYCANAFKCCGTCMQYCEYRCVQDVLHRFYLWCYGCYTEKESSREIQIMTAKLMDPRVKFEELLDMMYSKISPVVNKRLAKDLREEVLDENPYVLNYEPIIPGHLSEKGKYVKEVDPDTGMYRVIQWPDSGLCPYCMPDSTIRLSTAHTGSDRRDPITDLLRERKLRRQHRAYVRDSSSK